MRNYQIAHPVRRSSRLYAVAGLMVITLLAACINPFQTDYQKAKATMELGSTPFGAGANFGSILINPANSLQAQTIMPDLENLDSFAARRVISFTNITPGGLTRDPVDPWNGVDPIADIPYGTWTVTYEAFNAADDLIATGQATNVVINAESTPVLIDIIPLTAGDGTLEYTITFPSEAVTDVTVELVPWGGGTPLVFTAGNEFNADYADTGSLQIGAVIPSGAYRLRIQFSDNSTAGDGMHAPIVKIAQIYDGLVSSATTNITLAELRSPPDAPSNIIVEFTAENLFNVYWTDSSNTEQGFRMYQDDGFGNRQPLGTQLPAGTESATGLSSAFTLPVDDFTLEVVAFNQFGESAPLSFTFRLLGAAQFPNFQNSANTNSPLWAAQNDPGQLDWSTMIVGGGSEVNLYLSDVDPLTDLSALPAPIGLVGPPYDLSSSGPFTQLSSYNWRVETVGDIGNEGRVIYPVQEFTIRDGTVHVLAGADVAAPGSDTDPIGSIQAAVDLAEAGETLQISAGDYLESVVVDKNLAIIGSGAAVTTLTAPNTANQTTLSIQQPVTISSIRIVADGTGLRRGVLVNANTTIEDSQLSGGTATEVVNEARAIEVNGAANLTLLRNELWASESNLITSAAAVYAPGNYTGSMNVGSTLATDGNVFGSSVAAEGRLNHIFTPNGAGTGALTARHNTFASSSATGSALAAAVQGSVVFRLSGGSAVVSDNTVYGNQDQVFNAGTIPAIRVGVATAQVADNVIEMLANRESIAIGIYVDANASPTPALIERNRIYMETPATGEANTGIFADRSATIYNNIVVQGGNTNSTAGFRGIELRAAGSSVIHNTVVNENNNNLNSTLITVSDPHGANHVISNNILVGSGATGERAINLLDGTNQPAEIHANVVFGAPTDVFRFGQGNLGVMEFNAGFPYAAGNFSIDPQLDSLPSIQDNGWYAPETPLQTGTPAATRSLVLAGGSTDHVGAVNQDINGVARTGTISIGAHQVSGTTVIGAVGPAGGLVFFENPNYTDAAAEWRFLEAADADLANELPWGGNGIAMGAGLDRSDVLGNPGAGRSNTDIIVTAIGAGDTYAAGAADSFNVGVFADWFLPSIPELKAIHDNLFELDLGNLTGQYWASQDSQHLDNSNNANGLQIGVGTSGTAVGTLRTNNRLVRPARRF